MDKQKLKKLQKEMKDNCISLEKFLINYYGINCVCEVKMSHQDVKILYPHIKRLSFEELLCDKEALYRGNVISVKDSQGNIAPYKKPKLKELEICNIDYVKQNSVEDKIRDTIINENLKLHELAKLCKMLKNANRIREYRVAYKILKSKKYDNQNNKYKQKKLNLIMKGRKEND